MALIIMIMLTYGLIVGAYGLLTSARSRTELLTEFRQNPAQHCFVLVWLFFGYMFFIGIFVPVFGELEMFNTGWEAWKIGGIGSLGCWVVTWFWKF